MVMLTRALLMKETITKVLERYADNQVNLASEAARDMIATAIIKDVAIEVLASQKKQTKEYWQQQEAGIDY